MTKKIKLIISALLILSIFLMMIKTYIDHNIQYEYDINHNYRDEYIETFKGTPAWLLAKAIYREDVKKIKKILADQPELLEYKDPKHGITLATFASKRDKLEALYALIESGLDPNTIIKTHFGPMSIFIYYVSLPEWERDKEFSLVTKPFVKYKDQEEYIKLLLNHGANPNILIEGSNSDGQARYSTPLTEAITSDNLSVVKLLVENGADINFKDPYGVTPSIVALRWADGNNKLDASIIDYLIFEKKTDLSGEHSYLASDKNAGLSFPNVEILRAWVFDLDSEAYQIKLKYIDHFKNYDQDYYATEIRPYLVQKIQRNYPNDWQDYIERY